MRAIFKTNLVSWNCSESVGRCNFQVVPSQINYVIKTVLLKQGFTWLREQRWREATLHRTVEFCRSSWMLRLLYSIGDELVRIYERVFSAFGGQTMTQGMTLALAQRQQIVSLGEESSVVVPVCSDNYYKKVDRKKVKMNYSKALNGVSSAWLRAFGARSESWHLLICHVQSQLQCGRCDSKWLSLWNGPLEGCFRTDWNGL